MQAFAILRGNGDLQRKYLEALSNVYLHYKYPINASGTFLYKGRYQLGVCPIQLVEFRFPEECKNEALQWIWPEHCSNDTLNKAMVWPLKKILGCTEDIDLKGLTPEFMYRDFVDVTPIGIRKDRYMHVVKKPDGSIVHERSDEMFREEEIEDSKGNRGTIKKRGAEDI